MDIRHIVGERRVEMIREHKQPGGDTPLPPFPENLVFWAPLTQGDLSDHISGEVGVSSSGCSATWDSGEGMYLLSAATTDAYGRGHNSDALRYNSAALRANLTGTQTTGMTVYMVMREHTYVPGPSGIYGVSRYFSCSDMYDVWETSPRMNVLVDGARLQQSQIDTAKLWKVAVVYNPLTRQIKIYNNGSLFITFSWTDTPAAPLSVGLCSKNGHSSSTSSGYNTISFSAYVADVRIYNRQLTDSEIAQL